MAEEVRREHKFGAKEEFPLVKCWIVQEVTCVWLQKTCGGNVQALQPSSCSSALCFSWRKFVFQLFWRIGGEPMQLGCHSLVRGCALLLTTAFAYFTQGPVEKWRVKNVCDENPEETSHSGHETAGAHPLREADHAERSLGLHREVLSLCPTHCRDGAKDSQSQHLIKPHRFYPFIIKKTLQAQLPYKWLQIQHIE